MNSFTNVIFFRILRMTFYSTIALSFCTWIVQSSRYLPLLNSNISLARFFELTSFLLVDIVGFLLPITLAVSAAFIYHRLAESNQIVVLQSSGIAPQKILSPLMEATFLVMGYLYLSNAYLAPLSWKEFRRIEFNIKNNIEPPKSAGRVFSSSKFSVYAQNYLGNFMFGNIFIVDTRKENTTHTLFSELGVIKNNILYLQNGERLEINFDTHKNSSTRFKSYTYNLKEIIDAHASAERPNEKFLSELLKEIPNDVSKTKEQKALFHQKITSPLLSIIFSLLAFFLIVLSPYKRKVTYFRMGLLITIIILVQGIFLSFANIAAKNEIFSYINYFLVGILIIISLFSVREKYE